MGGSGRGRMARKERYMTERELWWTETAKGSDIFRIGIRLKTEQNRAHRPPL